MRRRRVRIAHDPARGYYVDLPTCGMVPGSWRPIVAGLIHPDGADPKADPQDVIAAGASVEVDLPEADCHPVTGAPSVAVIRERYEGNERFDRADYAVPCDLSDSERAEETALARVIERAKGLRDTPRRLP